jgi:hypothetical protein
MPKHVGRYIRVLVVRGLPEEFFEGTDAIERMSHHAQVLRFATENLVDQR